MEPFPVGVGHPEISAAAVVGSFLGAAALAGIVAQERGEGPEQMLAASRRAIEIAARGLSNLGQDAPAARRQVE